MDEPVFRLVPLEPHTGPGVGTLYIGRDVGLPGQCTFRIVLENWRGGRGFDARPGDTCIAAVVDGVPLRITDERDPLSITVERTKDGLVEVADRATGSLVGLEVVPCSAEHAFRRSEAPRHPGSVSTRRSPQELRTSPFWVSADADEPFWVRAPGYCYHWVDPRSIHGRFVQVAADRGADLRILVEPSKELVESFVRVEQGSRGLALVLPARDVMLLEGLPPVATSIRLQSGRDVDEVPLDSASPTLHAEMVNEVRLAPDAETLSDMGLLRGSLVGMHAVRLVMPVENLELRIRRVLAEDGTEVKASSTLVIRVSEMTPLEHGESYLWSAGRLAPGAYRIEVSPVGLLAEAWVSQHQPSDVDLSIGDLAEARIRVLDEDGRTLDFHLVRAWKSHVVHGMQTSCTATCQLDEKQGCLVYRGLPGTLSLLLEGAVFGSVTQQVDVQAGAHEVELRVSTGSWIDVRFHRRVAGVRSPAAWRGQVHWREIGGVAGPARSLVSARVAEGANQLSVCVDGAAAGELLFLPEAGYPDIAAIRVGAASRLGNGSPGYDRRSVEVDLD